MGARTSLEAKVYVAASGKAYSVLDLLAHQAQRGTMRVSDLHLKVGCPPVYRVDGRLERMDGPDLTPDNLEAMARALLSEEELQALRQDRSVDSSYASDTTQFRINCFRDNDGLALAIRALEGAPPPVEEIGFPNDVWRDIIDRGHGLVLVTGITGAGKSTTIASLIHRIASLRACRIITLEAPIEYRLRSDKAIISQREVGRDVSSFERGLRDCLREDPDVIFVGEMRALDSAAWTLTAAETGHLVFSTLHTRDVAGTVTRLLDMFPAERQDEIATQLSLGLSHVICQKLVPRADGNGRVVAMEILNNTYGVSHLIRTKKAEQLYTQLQTRTRDLSDERMTTMERSLAALASRGVVSPADAERAANDVTALHDELQRVGL